MLKLIPKK